MWWLGHSDFSNITCKKVIKFWRHLYGLSKKNFWGLIKYSRTYLLLCMSWLGYWLMSKSPDCQCDLLGFSTFRRLCKIHQDIMDSIHFKSCLYDYVDIPTVGLVHLLDFLLTSSVLDHNFSFLYLNTNVRVESFVVAYFSKRKIWNRRPFDYWFLFPHVLKCLDEQCLHDLEFDWMYWSQWQWLFLKTI